MHGVFIDCMYWMKIQDSVDNKKKAVIKNTAFFFIYYNIEYSI